MGGAFAMATRTLLAACATLLMLSSASTRTQGEGDGERCRLDADAEEDLRRDAGWHCAVRRARCLLARRGNAGNATKEVNDPECKLRICDLLSQNDTVFSPGIADDRQEIEPKLFCRSMYRIVWSWKTLDPEVGPSVFVVSIHQHGNDTWLKHDVVSEPKFNLDDLPSDAKFQLRVQSLDKDGSLAGSCSSEWISTFNENINLSQVANVTVTEEYQVSEEHVNMSIHWEPNKDDMPCDYQIYYWNVHGTDPIQEIDYQKEFTVDLPNLNFNSFYKAYIIAGSREQRGEKAEVDIRTPSCLDVWNNNLSICKPPPPEELHINFLEFGEGHYEMNISWIPGTILPEQYIVYMGDLINRSEHQFVNKNSTSVIFRNVQPEIIYVGCVIAISAAGNSSEKCDNSKFRAVPDMEGAVRKHVIIIIVSSSLIVSLLVILSFTCAWRHKDRKRKEDTQRCKYFENLEKEIPKENKNYESAVMYFDDEWEIPEDRLLVGDILGEGAFGVVRKGLLQGKTHLDPLEEVAVKMLRDNAAPEDMRQFHQEISMMKSVGTHPHIVSIIGCCTSAKKAQLIVEYCALGDLQCYLRQNIAELTQTRNQHETRGHVKYAELMLSNSSDNVENNSSLKTNLAVNDMYFESDTEKKSTKSVLQPTDLLSFSRQIAIGMEFLSSNRIVHRDLAARNVLVCANKTVKISDFGLSRDIYEQNVYQKKGAGILPVKWMALESLMYQTYTTQSDIWSFGILLWEIVTFGGMPYPGTPTNRLFQLLKTGYRMECPPNCSEELYDIMLSCWKPKPKDRPTFTELRNNIDNLLESSSPQQYLNLNVMNFQSPDPSSSTVDQSSSDSQKCSDECTSSHCTSCSSYPEQHDHAKQSL